MILKLGIRYFFSKKKDKVIGLISGFSLIGVAIGVAALIIVMGIMKGLRTELLKNIIGLNSHIIVKNIDRFDDEDIKTKLNSVKGIDKYMITVSGEALLKVGNFTQGIMVIGIRSVDLKKKFSENLWMNRFDRENIAISSTLKSSLNVDIASETSSNNTNDTNDPQQNTQIDLISAKLTQSILGSLPKAKTFDVSAIFNTGIYEYDSKIVFIDLDIAKNLFQSKADLEIYITDPDNVDQMTTLISDALQVNKNNLLNWRTQNFSMIRALDIEKIAMFSVLFLLVVVSGFNIIASITILVKDKMKDIAILKTIGVTNSNIWLIFFINGFLIGFFGVAIGSILGVGIGSNLENIRTFLEQITQTNLFSPAIYFLYHLPCEISLKDVILIDCAALVLCSLTSFYPSYKVYKLNVVDIIRNN